MVLVSQLLVEEEVAAVVELLHLQRGEVVVGVGCSSTTRRSTLKLSAFPASLRPPDIR